jgi:hypothetical protein
MQASSIEGVAQARLSLKVRTVIDYFVACFGTVPYWDR